MIKLKRLGHVLIKVRHLEKSKAFYRDKLGFEVVEEETETHQKTAFLSLGEYGHTLDLLEQGVEPDNSPGKLGMHHMAFQVESYDDLEDAYFQLLDDEVEIIHAMDHVTQKSIYFKDPDGNLVEIYYELPNALEMFRKGRGDQDAPLEFTRKDPASAQ